MSEISKDIVSALKKINRKLIDATNFIFILPVYYVGAGLAFLFFRLFNRENNSPQKSYWLISPKRKELLEEYKKQF
jgi:hypothetical protein